MPSAPGNFGPKRKVSVVSAGCTPGQGLSHCPSGPCTRAPARQAFPVPRRSFHKASPPFPVISNTTNHSAGKNHCLCRARQPQPPSTEGSGLAVTPHPHSRFSRPASPVTNTLFCCIKAKSFTMLLQLSQFCRLRGLTAWLFGPVGLEMTHKSFLFQTQLVVRKHISILSYGPLASQELLVPVVMITREIQNGMSKQPHLIHTCVPHHKQSPCR